MTYVDGEALAKDLGLSAFTDGKLLVMGTKETYDALKRLIYILFCGLHIIDSFTNNTQLINL